MWGIQNSRLNSQGSVFITIFLTLMVIVGVVFVYFYYTQLTSLGPPPIPLVSSTPAPISETANWKPYEDLVIGISLKIPNDWYVSEDNKIISQFPYNSKRYSTTNIYNNFSITRVSYQLQSGYTNDDWLNRINNLKPEERLTNEFRPATSLQIVKLDSGQTAQGRRFVIFKNTALEEGVIGAFERNEIVYQFVLQHYNQEGIDTFRKILSTAEVVGQVDPSPASPF